MSATATGGERPGWVVATVFAIVVMVVWTLVVKYLVPAAWFWSERLAGREPAAIPVMWDFWPLLHVALAGPLAEKLYLGVSGKWLSLDANDEVKAATVDAGLFWLGSGLTDPDLSLAATLILFGAYGLEKPAALNGPQFLTAEILAEPLAIRNGTAEVPSGPGLGVEVDEAKVAALMASERD